MRPDRWYPFKRVIHLSSIHLGRFDCTATKQTTDLFVPLFCDSVRQNFLCFNCFYSFQFLLFSRWWSCASSHAWTSRTRRHLYSTSYPTLSSSWSWSCPTTRTACRSWHPMSSSSASWTTWSTNSRSASGYAQQHFSCWYGSCTGWDFICAVLHVGWRDVISSICSFMCVIIIIIIIIIVA